MTISTHIEDGTGTGRRAKVSERGELITAPYGYTTIVSNDIDLVNTAYNFITPKSGYVIIITAILLYANKNVGVNDATVVIYTSTAGPTSTTVTETIFEAEMPKQTSRNITGLNIIIDGEGGRWVNAKTDDDDIYCQIGYYYAKHEAN